MKGLGLTPGPNRPSTVLQRQIISEELKKKKKKCATLTNLSITSAENVKQARHMFVCNEWVERWSVSGCRSWKQRGARQQQSFIVGKVVHYGRDAINMTDLAPPHRRPKATVRIWGRRKTLVMKCLLCCTSLRSIVILKHKGPDETHTAYTDMEICSNPGQSARQAAPTQEHVLYIKGSFHDRRDDESFSVCLRNSHVWMPSVPPHTVLIDEQHFRGYWVVFVPSGLTLGTIEHRRSRARHVTALQLSHTEKWAKVRRTKRRLQLFPFISSKGYNEQVTVHICLSVWFWPML